MSDPLPDLVPVSTSLPQEDFALLKRLAGQLGISMTDVIRRGIRNEEFIQKVLEGGGYLMVKRGSSIKKVSVIDE